MAGRSAVFVGGVTLTLLLALTACTGTSPHHSGASATASPGPAPSPVADPTPAQAATSGPIGSAGGHFDTGSAHALVPAGAVTKGTTVRVVAARAGGTRAGAAHDRLSSVAWPPTPTVLPVACAGTVPAVRLPVATVRAVIWAVVIPTTGVGMTTRDGSRPSTRLVTEACAATDRQRYITVHGSGLE
jgi:hypothetical protein